MVLTLLVLYAINASELLVTGIESDNVFLVFFSKLAYSVFTINIVDILSFIGVYTLISYVERKTNGIDILFVIVSMLFSFLYIWCFSYKLEQETTVLFANSFQTLLTSVRFVGYSFLFYLGIKVILCEIEHIVFIKNDNNKRVHIISSTIVFLGWIFWIVMAYPGSVAGDGVTQLGQAYFNEISAHHPPFTTWIMGTLFKAGNVITGSGRGGIFLYLFIQAILGAIIIGFSIKTMHKIGVCKIICYLSAAVFGFAPIFGIFAQWYEKDLLYSLFTLLFFTKLVDMVTEVAQIKVRDFALLATCGILCALLRNNGIYAVLPVFILILFLPLNQKLKHVDFASFIFVLVVYLCVTGPFYNSLGFEPTNIREALSIPMQQSARYISEYGDEITEEERDVLESVFNDYDNIANIYDAFCSDSVKNTVFIEKDELPRYFLIWLKMGLKHPKVYFDAFMCLNYGYLAPAEQNAEANGDMPNQEHDDIMSQLNDMGADGTQNAENIQILKYLIYMNMVFPLVRYLTMPGVYVWMMILIIAIVLKLKDPIGYIIIIPNVVNLLVCLASPLCNAMRYELPTVLSMPLCITVILWLMQLKKTKKY